MRMGISFFSISLGIMFSGGFLKSVFGDDAVEIKPREKEESL